jgi:SAM-dependent methyltransferase
MDTVACDLCGSRQSAPLFRLTDNLYGIPGEFVLQRCLQCGLMYLSPRPTEEAMGFYYPQDYSPYRPPVEDERFPPMRWMRRRKLSKRRQLIERYHALGSGCLLDVGCATGLFMHEMDQHGWRVTGVEPIPSAAAYARQRFNLQVFEGQLGEAPFQPSSFDVITFWDVLEHTFSPTAELARAARLLRPGGLLALSVPNWDSYERALFGAHWQGMDPPRHLYVFTRETLARLLDQAGFAVLDWVCFMPGYFSFILSLERWLRSKSQRIATVARRLFSLPGMRLPFEPWFALNNRLKKGPVISVFALKEAASGESVEL